MPFRALVFKTSAVPLSQPATVTARTGFEPATSGSSDPNPDHKSGALDRTEPRALPLHPSVSEFSPYRAE